MKDLLVFTGVGDYEDHFLSWASRPNPNFDRAINYYGDNSIRESQLASLNTEYYSTNSGMIWENFHKNFIDYPNYDYYLILDSDLHVFPADVEQFLYYVQQKKVYGSTWSRTGDSYGYFTPLFLQRNIDQEVYYSNWIEMCFMFLSNELATKTVRKWTNLNLSWSTGIDFVLANVASENNMLPFHVSNRFCFRNIPPSEKINGREIDFITKTNTEERLEEIFLRMEKDNFFKIKPMDIATWTD